jgi:hypothetical protein
MNGVKIEDAMERNINKLKIRYPGKFSKENALNRNIEAEQKALTVGDMKEWRIKHIQVGELGKYSGIDEDAALDEMIKNYPKYQEADKDNFKFEEIKKK